jgi:hypothetical protein
LLRSEEYEERGLSMKTFKRLLLYVTAGALMVPFASAQVATGSIAGTVHDPNGALIPAARVSAKGTTSGVDAETLTSEAGVYVFPSLPVGNYEITVEKAGFKKYTQTEIEVRVASRLDMNLTLQVGDVQQTVEVTAQTPLLETSSAQKGQSLSTQMMNTLPFFSGGVRNPRSFVNYLPGANPSTELSVSGSGGRAQEILIDGASATIPESGGTSFNFPSAEMFGEFKMLTSTFDAEYGRFGGGIEVYVTKSGTNDFHGTAFLNMRRDIWNANAWANNARGVARPKDRLNEYGVASGGPIWIPKVYDGRNKTFYFFTYTKDKRPITPSNVVSTVPTALMRQGNFSELPASQLIYDPLTTSGGTRTPFPGNIIPQNRFSAISQKLVSAIPNPTRPALTNNFDFVNVSQYDRYIWNLKFDHAFTPNNRLAFTVTKENELSSALSALPGALSQGLEQYQKPDNWRVNHDLVIKPTILLHTTFGYTRQRQIWDNPYQKGAATAFGFPGLSGDADAMPRVQFLGGDGLTPFGVQDGKVGNGSQINITYHLSQGLSWVHGAHEFKMGWEMRRLQTTSNPIDIAGSNGLYRFARSQTALPTNLSGTGHAFASLLLGLPDSAERTGLPVLIGNIRYGYHAAYFQDNWKVNSRLTLNLGMRYDLPINWHDLNGDYSGLDLNRPNPAAGGLPGALVFFGSGAGRTGEKRPYATDFSNFGPRFGFSFRMTDKTVIRGGYGLIYQTLGNGGCGCRTGFANPIAVNSDGLNGALNWDNGIAAPPGFRPPPVLEQAPFLLTNADVFSENFGRAPRVHSWSIGVQQEVSKFLFDISYVGNRGKGLNSTTLLNQLPVSRLALGSLLQKRIDDPEVIAQGFTKPYPTFPSSQSLAQALRPYPQYLDISERNSGIGRSWYDSLQAKVERRFGEWQFLAAYTYSKTLSLAHYRQIFSQNFATSGHNVAAQDNYNYNDDKSFMPFDLPHVFNILNTYTLPFGRGKALLKTDNFLVNLLVRDWTISSIQQYRSGGLILVQAPSNTLGTGVLFSQFKKANVGSGPIQTGIDRTSLDPNNPSTLWFNAAAFTTPGQYQLGNAAHYYSDFRNPPVFDERLALMKRMKFPVGGDRTVDVVYRADAFNLFNRTNFGGINGTIGNVNFGRPSGPQVGSRLITMGVRVEF